MDSITMQLTDLKTISDNTCLKIEEYFLDLVDRSMHTSSVTPSFQVKEVEDTVKDDCLIYVYVNEHKNKNNIVYGLTIMGSMKYRKEPYLKYMGKILIKDYLDLESTLDTSLSEYRIKNFKKISHKQRHLEDRNDTKSYKS